MSGRSELAATITKLWEAGADFESVLPRAQAHDAVRAAIGALDRGEARVAEVIDGEVVVHEWAKQAVLLWFRLQELQDIEVGPFEYVDRIPLKHDYRESGVRVVPGAQARFGSYLGRGVVLMPSYVNIGAYVDDDTMVDTWATVGSCAQIGADVHLAGGVGVGGVLEPLQARPVIVEDGAFIGSRCILTEGVVIGERAVLAPNVSLTGSVPVIDVTGSEPVEHRGYVPPNSVVVPGTRPKEFPAGTFQIGCALIIGRRNAQTDLKTSLNDVLREFQIGA
jgi:2,3,4,5-tetrahydropyridine-2-carboxylate N-succinyltransferase